MIVCIKGKDDDYIFNRLQVAGIRAEKEDAEGNKLPREAQAGKCLTQPMLCSDGQTVVSVNIEAENWDKLPPQESPNFTYEWRVDDKDEDGALMPWPEFNVDVFDEGVKVGERLQGAPMIR